jgi:hypothetical protein
MRQREPKDLRLLLPLALYQGTTSVVPKMHKKTTLGFRSKVSGRRSHSGGALKGHGFIRADERHTKGSGL